MSNALTIIGTTFHDGAVGIGTDTPGEPLHIISTVASTGIRVQGPRPTISFYDSVGVLSGSIENVQDPVGTLRGVQFRTPDVTGSGGNASDNWNTMRFNGSTNKLYFGDTGFVSWIQSGHALNIRANVGSGNNSAATPDVVINSGSVSIRLDATVGGSLKIPAGANQRAGNVTLIAGTATVINTSVTVNTIVMFVRKTVGGTVGSIVTYSILAGTSFTITSNDVLDTSTFSYFLIDNP